MSYVFPNDNEKGRHCIPFGYAASPNDYHGRITMKIRTR